MTKNQHKVVVLAICLLHIILVQINNFVYDIKPFADASILLDRGLEFANFYFTNPETNWNFAPGYSLFLAIIYPITQNNYIIVTIIQSILFAYAAYLFTKIASEKNILPEKHPLLSLAIIVLSPNIWFTIGQTTAENFAASLVLLTFYFLIRARDEFSLKNILKSSVIMGILFVSRFEMIFLIPLGWLFLSSTKFELKKCLKASLFFIFPILFISANIYKNYQIFEKVIPFSLSGGSVIYGGNNTKLDGSWHSFQQYETYMPKKYHQAFLDIHELEDIPTLVLKRDSLFKVMIKEAWEINPTGLITNWPNKFLRLWLFPGHFDIYTADKEYIHGVQFKEHFIDDDLPWYGIYKHLFYSIIHWGLLILSIIGFYLAYKKASTANKYYLYLTFLTFLAISILFSIPFYAIPRFHVSIISILTIFSVFSIDYIIHKLIKNGN